MNKSYRQGQILELVRGCAIHTQEELAQALQHIGIPATQVTLSRDIRELQLAKTPTATARSRPSPPVPISPWLPRNSSTTSAWRKTCWC